MTGMEDMEDIKGGDEKGQEDDNSPGSNGKKRKSPDADGAEKKDEEEEKDGALDGKGGAGNGPDESEGKSRPRKPKMVKEEVEDLHAETQRLLRETPTTSFALEPAAPKPVSSLIEKIRQRKLQLAQRSPKTSSPGGLLNLSSFLNGSKVPVNAQQEHDEIEIIMSKPPIRLVIKEEFKPPIRIVVKEEPGELATADLSKGESNQNREATDDTDDVEESSTPSTPDKRLDRSNSNSRGTSPPRSLLRPPVESQDLYSDSQLSLPKDDSPPEDDEDLMLLLGPRMNLRLDSETQDDGRWLEEDDEKENKDPKVVSPPARVPVVTHVRGLIDDEAEDEDDDDDSEDDGDEGDAEDLKGLLTQDTGEKPSDIDRRSRLHSKWLEQQDLDIEKNLLQRIENGWNTKGKMPALLNEKLAESVSSDFVNSVKTSYDSFKRVDNSNSLDLNNADTRDDENYVKSSDDEEAEENLRRQIFLQESEEKVEFLSVADDESSREIFSLINKVNVAAVKPRAGSAHTNGAGHHQLPSLQQSSFLHRKVTSTSATTRQGSGNSRSFVFGRDDSNSRDGSRIDSKEQNRKAKASDEQKPTSASQSSQKGAASSGSKSSLSKETKPRGPSLFQVLKQQAAELASGKTPLDLMGSSSRGDLAIFTAMKPTRQAKGFRGS